MSNDFEIEAPINFTDFLHAFRRSTREKGEQYFRHGRVLEVRVIEAGRHFVADVLGNSHYEVNLVCRDCVWTAACTCPMRQFCKHIYAAAKEVLAEQNAGYVSQLSAGEKAVRAPAALSDSPLLRALSEAAGRPLMAEEVNYVNKVRKAYQRCLPTREITNTELDQLGIFLGGSYWERLSLWPEFPKDEHLFWLYVARAARERGRQIPEFMQPVSDTREVDAVVERWREKQKIEKWRHQLAGARFPSAVTSASAGGYDFRIRLGRYQAEMEWKRPGSERFERPKAHALRQLANEGNRPPESLSLEAEIIWQVFAHHIASYDPSGELAYYDEKNQAALARLLLMPALQSRMVNEQGEPLRRAAEPLRWQMREPTAAEPSYRFRLVQGDGSPLPDLLFRTKWQPSLYVTADWVFEGPPLPDMLEEDKETAIPAAAIESAQGVTFLRKLGVDLPARLQARIRTIPWQVVIRCEIDKSFPSGTEICAMTVAATSTDARRKLDWNGVNWLEETHEKSEEDDELITVYDDHVLSSVPQLVAPLSPKVESYRSNVFSVRVTKAFAENFAQWLKTVPSDITVELDKELASLAQNPVAGRVRLDVSEAEIDWFDLRVVLEVSDTALSPEEIKLLLDARGKFVRIKGQGWKRLKFDLTAEDDEQLARLGLNSRELSSEPQRLHALQLAEPAAKRFLPETHVEEIQRRASEIKARVAPEIPARVHAELRPYQREGFHFLAYLSENRFGGILADDMGLGKTLQTLTWLAWLHERGDQESTAGTGTSCPRSSPLPSLVVCPKSVMDNWRAETAKFAQGLRVKVWTPAELPRITEALGQADLHVINYAQLRSAGETLAAVKWLAVILDEGQYIKNPSSQTAQVARALKASHRLVLSGTPIENRLLDLWSVMTFAMPGALGSRNHFAKLYDAKGDPLARKRLAARVRPFLIRRTKSQVATDLPDRIEEDLFCDMEGEQKTLYRAELKRAQQMLLKLKTQKELAKQQFHFLTSLLRLRQICCHPRLFKEDSQAAGAKVEALLEQLEPLMEEGHKVLVFSQFVEMLELLKPVLSERGWLFYYLAGETEKRGELVTQFQKAPGAAVFLISLKAGGFGLNLTAASYVVLFDPWWNPAVENQAIDRTHRIGQSNKVIAYRLLIKDSIEEKIRHLQIQKSALVEDVFGEEKFAQSLTLQDLQYLLAD